MISNCGALGLDWRATSLSTYLETLEAFNEANDPKAIKAPIPIDDGLRNFMKAHAG